MSTKRPTEGTDYQRRPFLAIEIYRQPSASARTHRKGWGDDPRNWRNEERAVPVSRMRPGVLRRASVILDIECDRLLKNRWGDEQHDAILAHYAEKYAAQIERAKALARVAQPNATAPVAG